MRRISIAALALVLGNAPAFAHVDMVSSVPTNGGVLAPGRPEMTLVFDALIKHVACALTDASGSAVAVLGAPRAEREKVVLPLTATLAAGSYALACKVAGPDGHDRSHGISFTVKAAP